MKLLSRLLTRSAVQPHDLYQSIVAQARQPGFYSQGGVPDTLDGRFEMVALHAFLVLHGLKDATDPRARDLGEKLVEIMFADMDRTLREMGVGDLGVGKRVKAMASSFYGRISAYDAGLTGPPGQLEEALRRNVFGTSAPEERHVAAMTGYVRREAERQKSVPFQEVMEGSFGFGSAPGETA